MNLEVTILSNLIYNEKYTRKVLPFLKSDYFTAREHKIIFLEIHEYVSQYDAMPSLNAIGIECQERTDLTEEQFKEIIGVLNVLSNDTADFDWLVDSTEKWCQERAIYLSLMESVKIADGQDSKRDKGAIPQILSEALGVSFDQHVGHDYVSDAEARYDFYHRKEDKIPFDLSFFNKITKGGLPNKTLNIALAGTGVGKSLFMCHCAAATLLQGKNVLYITLEMAEEKIAERIDANLLNVPIQQLGDLPKLMFDKKMANLSKKTQGKLIIKEYPTASAHVGHFKSLISDLALKRSIRPDIIFVDYLNICASQRYKGSIVNSYTYVKAIAEELRGLAVECNVPIISATQTTRSGYGSTDVDLTDTSESFGLPATADLMFALISTEELEGMNQIMVKQLKNRYNDIASNKRFCVGIDRSKMRLYDVEDSAQEDLVDSGQGSQEQQIDLVKKFTAKKTFQDLKYD
ncbi:DNA primase/helicase [Synechococcus phage S-RIM8]|uniref:DnaB-like replicative helicase n=3 Tax=root TaxID=1 RepID=A0A1D7SC51_9CAUD|nr:DNA primase/helicase [Synechococcus phage S-RIM8 A.HR1]YP_009783087.1 DNA primase/helicase [Synechococcus phage S-RIM8]AFB15438.1 DNA primase/helicase [Synechococcus phage S-RIM8 A.HR5]AFB17873.1 DNA primase/helicase [Synechococcus phage S-RIM8 A.HR3]AGH57873.1 DNA primase/helicase [Synechococcus phage KBS-M-1A]AFB17663.1 DNA primase/helicase [Synechococcus phage S-RIM8 A.HR1]AOO10325.1 DNA primase/helicase [Synechococcus phage S-RIM8]